MEANGVDGYDNDNNGFVGDVHGYDFVNNTGNIRDNNMHGTHVAGIAAAANNDIGIVGANPMALIMPVTVMQSDGTGDVATIIKGIDYAVANGATILNLSLGTYANSIALRQSLEKAYQKAVIVAAADTLSAARPGARYESMEGYINRLESLEKLAGEFEGVEKAFAIQAGREVRVLVKPEVVDDITMVKIAHDIRERIENELTYPGQIKVTLIREVRVQELAK